MTELSNKRLDNPNDYIYKEAGLFQRILSEDDVDDKLTKELDDLLQHKLDSARSMYGDGVIKEDWVWINGVIRRLNENIKSDPKEKWDHERLIVFCKTESDIVFHGFQDDSYENRASFARSSYEKCKPILINKQLWNEN